ncbi:hypothetical protein LJC17_03650 [Acholeplasma sp. OttesenSCG-928-E16]|nr:hypothetical protein [Acholeplasma sp. OttesenSCG-928-E16]
MTNSSKNGRIIAGFILLGIGIVLISIGIYLLIDDSINGPKSYQQSNGINLLIWGLLSAFVGVLNLIYKGRKLVFLDKEIVETKKGIKKSIKYNDIIDVKIIRPVTPTARYALNRADIEIISKKERIVLVNIKNPEMTKEMILLRRG